MMFRVWMLGALLLEIIAIGWFAAAALQVTR